MNRIAIAAISGVSAAVTMGAAYFGAPYAGLHIDGTTMVVLAAALAFGASTGVFMLLALNKPAAGKAYASTPLNDLPVTPFIGMFREPGAVQITARPELSVDEILARFGHVFANPADAADKKITLTIKATKKGLFNPVVLKDLFGRLKAFPGFEHVVLMGEADDFVGYISGPRAIKDLTGENAETKIVKCIVDVLADPKKSTALRGMNGAARDDTIAETEDVRHAAMKMWRDETVQVLVVYRHLKPVGVIDRTSILNLIANGA